MFKRLLGKLISAKDTKPARAYDLWALGYDHQPGNLMLELDEILFLGLLDEIEVKDKKVIDIGCGTGRHWEKLLARDPCQLSGYDVSEGMLQILQQKFPDAITYKSENDQLNNTEGHTTDILISTLTIAHIRDIKKAFIEWDRVLKPGGNIIITDYHPAALKKGGKRSFRYKEKTVSIKNYIHTIEKIISIAVHLNWKQEKSVQREIDDSVKPYFEKQNALPVFESFKGVAIIYGMLFKKNDET